MDTPQPIDVNRLKKMLGGAKTIMNKVENGDYETGSVDPRALREDTVKSVASERANSIPSAPQQNNVNGEAHYPNFEKSKMPDAIKQAMKDNPIPQVNGMPQSFTLDEVMDYENDEKQIPPQSRHKSNRKPITENKKPQLNSNEIRKIIREEMQSIVKDEMIEFFTKYFAKSLAEDTQKKLIQHLLKEGKISTSKRKK